MKTFFVFIFVLISIVIYSQESETPVQVQLKSLSVDQERELSSLPELRLPINYKNKSLPYEVDNTLQPFYSGLFLQTGLSCGQVACVSNGFAYEINRLRNLDGSLVQNKYPTHFAWNWENGGEGYSGASYYHSLLMLLKVGSPNMQTYGGTHDYGGYTRFMSGYDSYYKAMQNRISSAYAIKCSTEEGILTLKNWLNDHLDGSDIGGLAFFYSQHQVPTTLLPVGTEHAGEKVCLTWVTGSNHAMTITGYNDSIRWDYNGDGLYTNDIDLNDDEIIDVRDWEIGGFKMCNNYETPYNGWMMYRSLALSPSAGGIWNNTVNVLYAIEEYSPQLTYKVNIYYTNRKRIKIMAGFSTDLAATEPDYYYTFPIINFQGSDWGMQGAHDEDSRHIEIGLDVTPFLNLIPSGVPAKFFFLIHENDNDGWAYGRIQNFSVLDYTSGAPIEYQSSQTDVSIIQNGVTSVSVNHTPEFEKPEITSDVLPTADINQDYSYQLLADGGTAPYRWEMDKNYEFSQVSASLPEATSVLSGSLISLPFEFPFYGESYEYFYLNSGGLIDFSGDPYTLPYNTNPSGTTLVTFGHRKCIAPFYSKTVCETYYTSGLDYYVVRWVGTNIDVSLKLESNGNITIFYNNCNPNNAQIWTSGLSYGDLFNYTTTPISGSVGDIPAIGYKFYPKPISDIFTVSTTGLLTGKTTQNLYNHILIFKVTDSKGLTDTKILDISTQNEILSGEVDNNLELFPNPVKSKLGLLVKSPIDDIAKIKIYTLDGKLLSYFEVNTNSLTFIDFNIYPSGNYLIVAQTGNRNYSRKLIKN